MDLTPYVEALRQQLAVAAEAGGDDARALAERLAGTARVGGPADLLDALSAAAEEITSELAPGSVERAPARPRPRVRRDAPAGRPAAGAAADAVAAAASDEGATARINLRLPEQLKARVEQAAGARRLSVNSWLVRAAAARCHVRAAGRAGAAGGRERPVLHRLGR